MEKKRPTIAELEAILNSDETREVHVLPDGSITTEPPAAMKLVEKWRQLATESRDESGRIRGAIKEPTDAEERCLVRAEIWDRCATDLEAFLKNGTTD